MSLICMAVYDTEENKRGGFTRRTLANISDMVDFSKHRMIIIDNNSCEETKELLKGYEVGPLKIQIITLLENIGTARAINIGWSKRDKFEHVIKMDNDVIVRQKDWVDRLEEAIKRDPSIGICGLKRNDLIETPNHESEFFKSKLYLLPHKPDETWIIGEEVVHLMGTCQMYNWRLLEKIGYLYQPGIYGYDDSLASVRSNIAGFKNVFLSYIPIDHIDMGDNKYSGEKADLATQDWFEFIKCKSEYLSGKRPIYQELY